MLSSYYYLTKPGIIYGNALTVIAGFLLASNGHIDFWLLIATLLGISLVIGSACVFNNFIDKNIDSKMSRTKNRALVVNTIPTFNALLFGTIIGMLGFLILWLFVNNLTIYIGIFAFVVYVVVYGIAKRDSVYGTLVGSLAGAAPIIAGYCAVSGQIDTEAILLYLIMLAWQMPHFYAISIYRLNDYEQAKIPVWPAVKGLKSTKYQILIYIFMFLIVSELLWLNNYVGNIYFITMTIFSLIWIYYSVLGFSTNNSKIWARQMFKLSLVILVIFSALISINPWIA